MLKRFTLACVAALGLLVAQPALAQGISQKVAPCDWSYPTRCEKVNTDGSTNVVTSGAGPTPITVTDTTSAKTITNASVQYLAAAARTLLAVDNESTTATIACRFGATAALNTAGSFTIPPGYTRVWNSYPVPTEALNCISSAATSPATFEVY